MKVGNDNGAHNVDFTTHSRALPHTEIDFRNKIIASILSARSTKWDEGQRASLNLATQGLTIYSYRRN